MKRKYWLYGLLVVLVLAVIFRTTIRFEIVRARLQSFQPFLLMELQPQARHIIKVFIKRVKDETGYELLLTSVYRSFSEQERLYIDPLYPDAAQPGYSFHNYGLAIDINALKDGIILTKKTALSIWNNSGIPQIANQLGLRWGGNIQGIQDPIHFDFAYFYNINDLHTLAIDKYGSNTKFIRGNRLNLPLAA